MKRGPQYDFRVLVWPEVLEWYYVPDYVRLFDGIYNVILNDSLDVKFVPGVDLTRPAPPLPTNMANVTTVEEARWFALMTTAGWAVLPCTPDVLSSQLALSHRLPGDEEWAKEVGVIYVGLEEFSEMSRELDTLADQFNGIHDYKPCSALAGYRVIDFIRTRIADADYLSAFDKYRVGRGPSPF